MTAVHTFEAGLELTGMSHCTKGVYQHMLGWLVPSSLVSGSVNPFKSVEVLSSVQSSWHSSDFACFCTCLGLNPYSGFWIPSYQHYFTVSISTSIPTSLLSLPYSITSVFPVMLYKQVITLRLWTRFISMKAEFRIFSVCKSQLGLIEFSVLKACILLLISRITV